MFFMFIKEFHIELNCLFLWFCDYMIFTLTLLDVFLMTLFSWVWYVLYRFWVLMIVWLTFFHGIYSCFIPYLKDFVLVCKIILKLVHILHFGRVFKLVKIIFKSYFWKPLPSKGWLDGRPCLVCLNWKSI